MNWRNLAFLAVIPALLLSGGLFGQENTTLKVQLPARDQQPPQYPNGSAVTTTLPATGDPLCWGDPSADGRFVTGEFGEIRGHKSSPHAGVDFRAFANNPVYAVADGCVSFGNPTARQLIGVKVRINDKFPNSSVWYLHMSRVVPKFINDGRAGVCIPIRKGELLGYSGNFYGSGGKEVSSGAAHLHLSYFASGLQLNPAPYANPPIEIPREYNTIKSVNDLAGEAITGPNTGDASGTRGSRLAFAVPRMCNSFVVKNTRSSTIPYDGRFGIGAFTASPVPPTQAEQKSNQAAIRQAVGATPANISREKIADPAHWTGGMPEEPDWNSYKDMSSEQIFQAEVSRRISDQRWTEELAKLSERGVAIERARMHALATRLMYEILASRQRQQVLLATLQITKAKRQQLVRPAITLPIR